MLYLNYEHAIDLPSNTKPNYLYTQAEVDLANRRMEEIGRKPPGKFTKQKVRLSFPIYSQILTTLGPQSQVLSFFTTWHLYLLTLRKRSRDLIAQTKLTHLLSIRPGISRYLESDVR